MNDKPTFDPFQPQLPTATQPPTATSAADKKKRERKPRAATEAKPPRKPSSKTRTAKPAAGGLRVDLAAALAIATGIKEDDKPVLLDIMGKLTQIPKASRQRILVALGKLS